MASSASSVAHVSSFKPELSYRPDGYRTPPPPAFEPLSPVSRTSNVAVLATEGGRKRKHTALSNAWKHESHKEQPLYYRRHAEFTSSSKVNGNLSSSRNGTFVLTDSAPSPLDVFASVATSPSLGSRLFANDDSASGQTHTSMHHNRRLSSSSHGNHIHNNSQSHRHSKRTRSEQIGTGRTSQEDSIRPATSHRMLNVWDSPHGQSSPTDKMFRDAESRQGVSVNLSSPRTGSHEATVLEAELLLGFAMSNRERALTLSSDTDLIAEHYTQPLIGPSNPPYEAGKAQTGSKQSKPTKYFTKWELEVDGEVSTFEKPSHNFQDSSSNVSAVSDVQYLLQDQTAPKQRRHKGWPKGKPRGPRNSSIEGKKLGQNRKKKTLESKRSRAPGRLGGPKKEATNPWIPETPTLSHTRRSSTSAAMGPFEATKLKIDRRLSVPPEIPMVVKTIRQGPGRPRVRKLPPVNICPVCGLTDNPTNGYTNSWIGCNGCRKWYHSACAGFAKESVLRDVDKYFCHDCEPKHGATTFVRKSSRAHASVDYAGLNEGNLRTAVDVPEHHYIKPIRDGTLELTPESFARMPPELVTAAYFERSGGMTEPVLIPAHLNPRPRTEFAILNDDEQEVGQMDESHQTSRQAPPSDFSEGLEYDCVLDEGQDNLGMVIPHGLTVRAVAELYGPEERVEVIDVKLQEGEDKRWNMHQWADYYEAEGEKPVRNVISLEVSQSRLGKLIKRPTVVRNLDLQDAVWPLDEQAKGSFPKVQFYCLMSVADCYTDFHIDFGGSSVYYHILKGRKTFFFIPPKPHHLKKYEEWCLSPNQNQIWLGNETKECYRVDLHPGDTMLIPSGWIHAVWTPENSLVIGGNFLTRMHYSMQLQINEIEKSTGVGKKFRYPYFQKIMWFALIQYLQEDPLPFTALAKLVAGDTFHREVPIYHLFENDNSYVDADSEYFNSRYYSQAEMEGLPDLLRFLLRTVMIATGKITNVSKTSQEAVMKSMPKGYGDHTDLVKIFAMWIAWKRGNETIPSWAYPNANLSDAEVLFEKKASAAATKAAERQAAHEAFKASSERRSLRPSLASITQDKTATDTVPLEPSPNPRETSSNQEASQELSCNECQQRRVHCKHGENDLVFSNITKLFGVKSTRLQPPVPEAKQEPIAELPLLSAMEQSNTSPEVVRHSTIGREPTEGAADAFEKISPGQAPKRPRTKACEECRKSKRRCVHDENGRIDPVKASETPVPRGSKRPRVDNVTSPRDLKGVKVDTGISAPKSAQLSSPPNSGNNKPFAPPGFVGPGTSPFSPMAIAVGSSIPGLFEARSAFDEMRSWAQQPIKSNHTSTPPKLERNQDRLYDPTQFPGSTTKSRSNPKTLSHRDLIPSNCVSVLEQPHQNDSMSEGSSAHSADHKQTIALVRPPALITSDLAEKFQPSNDKCTAGERSDAIEAPPFSPLTDGSTPSPPGGLKDQSDGSHQSQSRTPSVPTHTGTTESNGRTASGNSSPLTESEPSSDKKSRYEVREYQQRVLTDSRSLSTATSPEQTNEALTQRDKPCANPTISKHETLSTTTQLPIEKDGEDLSKSRGTSQDPTASKRVSLPKADHNGMLNSLAILEEEKGDDARMARSLQEEEFGLRRRKS